MAVVYAVFSTASEIVPPAHLMEKANQGDSNAQVSLGLFYMRNHDMDNALIWWKKAAKSNNADACLNLGSLYLEQQDKQAKDWYMRAVELGEVKAFRGMGLYYDKIEHNTNLSIKWFTEAANKEDTYSQRILGFWYYRQNQQSVAIMWFEKAIAKGDVLSMHGIADVYIQLEDSKKAFSWYKKAAEKGDVECQSQIAYMYTYGQGVELNHDEARYWMKRAAEGGYSQAQFNLGLFYSRGSIGLEKDEEKAFTWFMEAAQQGHAEAQNNVGVYYFNRKQFDEAYKWWKIASDKGNKDATKNLKRLTPD